MLVIPVHVWVCLCSGFMLKKIQDEDFACKIYFGCPMAWAAVHSRAMLQLLIHCLLLFALFIVLGHCIVMY